MPDHDYHDFFPCLERIRVCNDNLIAIDKLGECVCLAGQVWGFDCWCGDVL